MCKCTAVPVSSLEKYRNGYRAVSYGQLVEEAGMFVQEKQARWQSTECESEWYHALS